MWYSVLAPFYAGLYFLEVVLGILLVRLQRLLDYRFVLLPCELARQIDLLEERVAILSLQ